MKIKVLYEDSNIVAIDKPSGLSVHPAAEQVRFRTGVSGKVKKVKEQFITDWILKNYPKMKNVGESVVYNGVEIPKPGIVHRLDKETSGVLLLAKNARAYEFLKSQFKGREIKKTYHAIVSGFMKTEKGIVNKPIGRSPSDFRRHLAGRGARGNLREAITEYKVLKRFNAPCSQNFSRSSQPKIQAGSHTDKNFESTAPFSYLEISPKTGRTHQIRVHMKFLNHPVACDDLYNPGAYCPEGIERLALHAKSIEFADMKGKIIKIESPLPKEFKSLVK